MDVDETKYSVNGIMSIPTLSLKKMTSCQTSGWSHTKAQLKEIIAIELAFSRRKRVLMLFIFQIDAILIDSFIVTYCIPMVLWEKNSPRKVDPRRKLHIKAGYWPCILGHPALTERH